MVSILLKYRYFMEKDWLLNEIFTEPIFKKNILSKFFYITLYLYPWHPGLNTKYTLRKQTKKKSKKNENVDGDYEPTAGSTERSASSSRRHTAGSKRRGPKPKNINGQTNPLSKYRRKNANARLVTQFDSTKLLYNSLYPLSNQTWYTIELENRVF